MNLISNSFLKSVWDFKTFQIGDPKIIPLQYPDGVGMEAAIYCRVNTDNQERSQQLIILL
jgi:hypothetical protein